eukprot:6282159-Alexandrium_andersonii.AAC.1
MDVPTGSETILQLLRADPNRLDSHVCRKRPAPDEREDAKQPRLQGEAGADDRAPSLTGWHSAFLAAVNQ